MSAPDAFAMSIPFRLRRAGKEMRLVVDDCSEQPLPDPALIRLVIRAHGIRDQLLHDRSLTLEEIAKSHGGANSELVCKCTVRLRSTRSERKANLRAYAENAHDTAVKPTTPNRSASSISILERKRSWSATPELSNTVISVRERRPG